MYSPEGHAEHGGAATCLKRQLAERDATIARLEPLAQRWEAAESARDEAVSLVGTLQSVIAERDATIAEYESSVNAWVANYREAQDTIASRDATIARLQYALDHIAATARPWPLADRDDLAKALRRASDHAKAALAEQPS